MSLCDDLQAEVTKAEKQRSQIEVFLDALDMDDRAEFDAWLKAPANKSAMWRVLRRRGLSVAEPTFRAWVGKQLSLNDELKQCR